MVATWLQNLSYTYGTYNIFEMGTESKQAEVVQF